MSQFEYKVIPAPKKGTRAKGAKTAEARFAVSLANLMNELGAEGWAYQRSDTLPCETRSGFRGKTTVFQNMLIFRRTIKSDKTAETETTQVETPEITTKGPAPKIKTPELRAPEHVAPELGASSSSPETEPGEAPKLGPAREDAGSPDAAPKIGPPDVAAQ